MRSAHVLACALALIGLIAGCGTKNEDRPATDPTAATAPGGGAADPAAAMAEARTVFQTRCVACHGESGQGDGPGSAALTPKPRDFSDPAWQHSVTDEHLETIIVGGGAAVGKSPAMPANPDLAQKSEVVEALRQLVRSLGG